MRPAALPRPTGRGKPWLLPTRGSTERYNPGVLLATAFVVVLAAALSGQRGAAEPPDATTRSLGRSQLTVVSGTLTGTVRDQSRALVSGLQVTVRLESDANVEPHRTTTDKEGRFRFAGLPLGTYCLVVRQPDGATTRRNDIRVRGAQETNVPIVLGEPPPTPTPGAPRRRPCSS